MFTNPYVIPASLKQRITHSLRAATVHLLLSVAVAGLVGLLVFGTWFPAPLREVFGGGKLFWLIVSVDVVCGPLLTLVIFNPTKPRTELHRDLALVAVIQLLALGYGVNALSYARPVALVHEVDRFRVVSFADLDETEASNLPTWVQPWSLSRLRTVGIRHPRTGEEKLASISASLQGVEPSQRPSWWQDYALSVPEVLKLARPLPELQSMHPSHTALINAAVVNAINDRQSNETTDPVALRWLPLVSRRATDWVVLLDPVTARVRGYVHVDGF